MAESTEETATTVVQEVVIEPILNDDQILDFVQRKRHELVKEITKTGMPTDNGERGMLLSALRDMSHDVLTKKKIGSEERASSEQTRAIVTAILTAATPQTGRVVHTTPDVALPSLDTSHLDPLETVDDETRQGEIHDTFEDFQKRMAEKQS